MLELFTATITRSKYTFKTSLEVVKEVMNVPMEAIHAIARMNGISTADNHEQIIPESELQPFIEAFERKTRNYFVNSMRNHALLTSQELQTFTEFCKTFKKGNVSLGKVSNWSHIGKTKLRQYFVDKIKQKTPSLSSRHSIDLFSGSGATGFRIERLSFIKGIEPYIYDVSPIIFPEYDSEYECTEYLKSSSKDLLREITSSWQYRASVEPLVCYNGYVPDFIRWIILAARYYVYIDDDDDHESDTIIFNGHSDLIINSTCRMVA